MVTADDLLNAVDTLTGHVSFSIPLVELPGRNGLDLKIAATYSGSVWKSASTWNLDAPTGVLGLGWNLALPRVFAVFGQSAAPEAAQYYLSWRGSVQRLWCTGPSGNGWSFGTSGNDPWQIVYQPGTEIWSVIDEDGVTHIFGDRSSGRNTVAHTVCWGNWVGASANLQAQQTIASGWLLNRSQNRFGDSIVYTYGATNVAVSGAQGEAFTQSVVLLGVVAVDGSQVLFTYGQKQAGELQNPHTNPLPPNAYQDPLNPLFLDHIAVQSSTGSALFTLQCSYPAALLGPENFGKRLLSSVQQVAPDGLTRPPLQLSYFGQNQQDGVSPSQPFNATTHALYGSVAAVTLIDGGVVTFSYAQTGTLQYAARQLALVSPAPGPTQPLFYFEDNYLVATWLGSDNNCWVVAYTWNGRWIAQQLATVPVGGATGYAAVQVVTSQTGFALWGGGRLYLFYPDPMNQGSWIAPSAVPSQPYYTPTFNTGETAVLASGDGFAGIMGLTSGKLYLYRWLGLAWTSDAMIPISGSVLTLAARDGVLVVLSAPSAAAPANVWLYRRDMAGNWETSQSNISLGTTLPASISLVMGGSFAAYMGVRTIGANQQVQYAALWWSADLTAVQSAVWPAIMVAAGTVPAPPLVAGDVIAVGNVLYRFDGAQWNDFNLGAVTYPNESGAVASIGADVAVRRITSTTGGQTTYEVSSYNPNTAAWAVTTSNASSALLAIAAPRTRESISNYAVSAGAVQYRQPNGVWAAGQALPGTFSVADLATMQLLVSDYLIYQQGTGTPGVQTLLYLLQNGATTSQTPISLANQQIAVPEDTRNMLVGRRAFLTYTGTFGNPSSVLTLYRPVNLDAVSAQTAYVVASVIADNGYSGIAGYAAQIQRGFIYNGNGATISADGILPLFNMASTMPGTDGSTTLNGSTVVYRFNGLTSAETPVLAYPTGNQTNAVQNVSAVAGLPYIQQQLSASSAVVEATTWYQWAFVIQLGSTGAAARVRVQQETDVLDGVQKTSTSTFDPVTGLVTLTSQANVNDLGQNQLFTRAFKYFWQIYDPTRTLNILTPVIQVESQTINSSIGVTITTAVSVQTFRENWGFGNGQWAPDRTFVAQVAPTTPFNSWRVTDPDPAGWTKVSQTLARTALGLPLDAIETLGRHTAATYDSTGQYVIVSAFNSASGADTLSWYGCEPYETFGPWTSTPPGSITDYLTTADFHTGTQCLALPPHPGTVQGPMAILQPADQTRQYVFSCWVRAANGFSAANGVAQAVISFFNPANGQPAPSVQPITVTLTPANAPSLITRWNFFPIFVNLPALVTQSGLTSLGLTVTLSNANQNSVCYVDELRFMPVDCRFQSAVYDPADFLTTAIIDSNGQAQQLRYDSFLVPFLKLGPLDRVDTVTDSAYSKNLTTAGTFAPAVPNRTLTLASTLASRYYDFHDGNTSDWQFTDAPHWQMTNGQLVYSGAGAGPIGATAQVLLYQPANFAARVTVVQSGPGVSVALGDGIYFMTWNAALSEWQLIQVVGATVTVLAASKVTSTMTGSWTFAVVDGFVVAYVNAIELFSYQYTPPTTVQPGYGKATLAATGLATFDDLVLLDSPQMNVTFGDGLGTVMQNIGLFGYVPQSTGGPFAQNSICMGSGCFYDSLGRVEYAREPLTAALVFQSENNGVLPPARLLNGDPTSYLTDSSGNKLNYSPYLQGSGGSYTYSQITYETAPTSRRVTSVAPRPQPSDILDFTTTMYYYGSATVTPPAPGSAGPGPGLNYSVTAQSSPYTKNPQNVRVLVDDISSFDQTGRMLMRLQGPHGGTYQTTAYLYDDTGRVIQIRQPNYFAPPNGSSAATWVISMTYTYLGLLASRTTPDDGLTQFMYDSANRLRFSLDANGAALSPPRIRYVRYDNFDRVVEQGYIQDANYLWGATLQGKADVEQFPVLTPPAPQGPNSANGKWLKRMTYDVGASGSLLYLLGRLYQAQINQNLSPIAPDTETYAYDAYGNIVSKTVNMAALTSATYTTQFVYNNQNQLQEIIYPALDANNPTVAFTYDRLGRMAAVGFPDPNDGVVDPINPPPMPSQRFAVYQYDWNGRLLTAKLNTAVSVPAFTRTFSYNASGWPTGIADPYFSESLGYSPGADNLAYLNGAVASSAMNYMPGPNAPVAPVGYSANYAYDGYGRMVTSSVPGRDGWSVAIPGNGYDANGNLQTLVQGQSSTAYAYAAGGNPLAQLSNRVTTLAASVQNSINFDTIPPTQTSASGWTWGSNNGGPSSSKTTQAQHPPNLAQSLELTGGSLGHYEVFCLATYLPPSATVTLSWQVMTGQNYGQVIGGAAWYAILYRAEGTAVSVPIASITAGTGWQPTATVQVPLASLASTHGVSNVVQVGIELRNQGRTPTGSTGPSIFLAGPSLTGANTAPAYQYDGNGNTTQAMSRNLSTIAYDSVTGRTTSIQLGSSAGNVLNFSYGLDDYRTLKTYQTPGNSPTVLGQVQTLSGLDGQPLAERTTVGATSQIQYYVPGVGGLVAMIQNGEPKFLLRDHVGSLRVVVDSATGAVDNAFDYLPFGSLIRASNQPEITRMFTGQDLDSETGLYDFHARLYDAALGRFYETDPVQHNASPYVYVSDDPINNIDPTGEAGLALLVRAVVAVFVPFLAWQFGRTAFWYYACRYKFLCDPGPGRFAINFMNLNMDLSRRIIPWKELEGASVLQPLPAGGDPQQFTVYYPKDNSTEHLKQRRYYRGLDHVKSADKYKYAVENNVVTLRKYNYVYFNQSQELRLLENTMFEQMLARGSNFHSDLAELKNVDCAGELFTMDGIANDINTETGHYYKTEPEFNQCVEIVKEHIRSLGYKPLWGQKLWDSLLTEEVEPAQLPDETLAKEEL